MLIILAFLFMRVDPGERFRAEYPREVAALQREFADVRGVATLCQVSGEKLGPVTLIQFASGPGHAKFEVDALRPRGATSFEPRRNVICRDEKYCFRLVRLKKEGSYSIVSIEDDWRARSQFTQPFGKYLDAPWTVGGTSLSDRMSSDRFRIIESQVINEAGRELIEVYFESGRSTRKPDLVRVVLDPSLHWAVVRSETKSGEMNDRVKERSALTYFAGPSGSRYIHDVRLVDITGLEALCDFSKVEFVATPRSEFAIEYYGLKNPHRKPSDGSSIPLWMGGVAIAVGLLILGRWLARREARSVA